MHLCLEQMQKRHDLSLKKWLVLQLKTRKGEDISGLMGVCPSEWFTHSVYDCLV